MTQYELNTKPLMIRDPKPMAVLKATLEAVRSAALARRPLVSLQVYQADNDYVAIIHTEAPCDS